MSLKKEESLRVRHNEICKILDVSPPTLRSFTGALYGKGLVDIKTKSEVLRLEGYKGADTLLDYVLLQVQSNSQQLDIVIEVMFEEEALSAVAMKLKAEFNEHSKTMPKVVQRIADMQKMDATIYLEQLKEDFEELLLKIGQSSHEIDVTNLRLRINWFITMEGHSHSLYDSHLREIESSQTAASILNCLIRCRFVGCLNFKLVEVFVKASGNNAILQRSLELYEKKFLKLLDFDFSSIITALQDPRLEHVPPVGLPMFSIRLGTQWEGKTVYTWKEFFENRFSWPHHLLVVEILENCVLIQYAVLPFFISVVLRDLSDPLVVEELRKEDVGVELSTELYKMGSFVMAEDGNKLEKEKMLKGGEVFPTTTSPDVADFLRIQDLAITERQMCNLVVAATSKKSITHYEMGKACSVIVIEKVNKGCDMQESEEIAEDLQEDLQQKTLEVKMLKEEVKKLKENLTILLQLVEENGERKRQFTPFDKESAYDYVTFEKGRKPHAKSSADFNTSTSVFSSKALSPPIAPHKEEPDFIAHPLQSYDWYWGELSREEVACRLRDTPDGTYLVCDSHGPGDYILFVRQESQNKLIHIYCVDGLYGFSGIGNFLSVPELIGHYSKVPLSQWNPRLHVKLESSVNWFAWVKDTSEEGDDDAEISELLAELDEKTKLFDMKYDLYQSLVMASEEIKKELERANSAVKARKNIVDLLKEQLERLKKRDFNGIINENLDTRNKVIENVCVVKEKVFQAENLHKLALSHAKECSSQFRSVDKELNATRAELMSLKLKKDQYTCKLVQEGLTHHEISLHVKEKTLHKAERIYSDQEDDDDVFKDIQWPKSPQSVPVHKQGLKARCRSPKFSGSIEERPHNRQDTWYVECGRIQAEMYLRDKPNGTFLCRPAGRARLNSDGGIHTYTIDLVYNGMEHLKVVQNNGKYGFTVPCAHSSLLELIVHYSEHSLEIYNPKLTITLAYPLNG